jgi:hypothetical protein
MQNKNKNIFSEYALKLVKACPNCKNSFNEKQIDLVEENEDGFLVYFMCSKCLHSYVANIKEMPFGLVGSAMLTDLELNEVQKFKNAERVVADDVLDVHEKLMKK